MTELGAIENSPDPPSTPATVLIVDDRPDKLLALETVLENTNSRIVKAASGPEALRLLLKQDFAVILLDVSMPEMDGFETAALIRQRPRSQQTPIIFVTSINTNETHVSRGYSLGAVDYIFSPIEPEILRTKVAVFIELYEKTIRIKEQSELLRRQAEKRAMDVEARLEQLLNVLDVGIFRVAEDGSLIDANPAFLRLLGVLSTEEIQASGLEAFNLPLGTAAVELPAGPLDVELRRADGSPHWTLLNYCRGQERDGPRYIEGLLEDIEKRKRAEEELRILNETLERRVEERAEELKISLEHLKRSERLAALGTLAAGIAHEINNPLNSILMTAQYALRNPENLKLAGESLDTIAGETKRCSKIIKGILQFARHEHKARHPENLNAVVLKSVDLVKTYVHSRLVLDLDLSKEPLSVELNPTEIEQVVINVIQNAISASQDETTIRLCTERRKSFACLRVIDNGPGIKAEILDKIFDPFFTTRSDEGGTGLGLSVVHGIVTDHQGSIRVNSTLGKGTEFIIEFPIAAADSGLAAPPVNRRTAAAAVKQ